MLLNDSNEAQRSEAKIDIGKQKAKLEEQSFEACSTAGCSRLPSEFTSEKAILRTARSQELSEFVEDEREDNELTISLEVGMPFSRIEIKRQPDRQDDSSVMDVRRDQRSMRMEKS
jgi:hypothetical protein